MARPQPEPVFFLDECLGDGDVADGLRTAGGVVEVFLNHFASGTRDEIWIAEVGKRGWVILTKDKLIQKREIERQALLSSGTAAFVLVGKHLDGQGCANAFCRAITAMKKNLRSLVLPFIAKVTAHGKVEVIGNATRKASIRRDNSVEA